MTPRARHRTTIGLLATAVATLIVLLVLNWSHSVLAGLASVGLGIALVVAFLILIGIAFANGDFL